MSVPVAPFFGMLRFSMSRTAWFAVALGCGGCILVSPVTALVLMLLTSVVAAGVDGRWSTAVMLIAGWLTVTSVLLTTLSIATLHRPAGTDSLAGLAFVVFPLVAAAMSTATTVCFGTAALARRWLKGAGSPSPVRP